MISYVLLYDRLPDSFFLRHILSLDRFDGLRVGEETYGTLLRGLPPLATAKFISLSEDTPDSARRIWDQCKMALLHCEADVKDNDHVIFFNMRHYPVDWVWFRRLLEKLELTDIPLVVRHLGRIALIGARWSDSAESIDCTETAVIEHTDDQFVDTGLTDNVLRLVGANFSLRYFNKLSFARAGYFRKSSLNITKIRAEYDFLSTLPAEVRPFYPAVGDLCETEGEGEYEVEIIPAFDVAKLLMHGRFVESRIIDAFMKALEAYLESCPRRKCTPLEYAAKMRSLFVDKTEERLDALARLQVSARLDLTCQANGFDSLRHFAKEHLALCKKSIEEDLGDELVFSHGDLFFSNILFDPLSGKIKLIDPRGGKDDTPFLPAWYDIAKLSHSFLGRYDMLAHGEFSIVMAENLSLHAHITDMPGMNSLMKHFLDFLAEKKINIWRTRLYEASLFLSMLPLHTDSPLRMQAQLLQALDIHKLLMTPGTALWGAWSQRGEVRA